MPLDSIKTNLVGLDQPKIIYFDKTCDVKTFKLLIFFLYFHKTKDMEPSKILFRRYMFLVFVNLKKNINNLIVLTPADFRDISHFCQVVQLRLIKTLPFCSQI